MVLNEEKRTRLDDVLARCQGALSGIGASAPSAPIVAVPLATTQASPILTPLEKNKGVVAIDSNDDEDTEEGIVFKRRRVAVATTSHSATSSRPASFRDQPPSASSSRGPLALEVVGRAPLGMTKLHPPPSFPLSFSTPSKASKKKVQQTIWKRI